MARTFFEKRNRPITDRPSTLRGGESITDRPSTLRGGESGDRPSTLRGGESGTDRPSALPKGESGADRPSTLRGGGIGQTQFGHQHSPGGESGDGKKAAAKPPCGPSPDECARTVYDDTDVCALMGLRRRILVQARTRRSRGVDWGAVGSHVGMTAAWVARKRPDADLSRLAPIRAGDGIVTVEVVAHCQNVQVAICRRVADGTKELVRVRDSRHLHIGDQFDAERIGTMLQHSERLNPERY